MSRLGEVDERAWGRYKVTDYQELNYGRKAMTKIIEIDRYKNISYQFHHHREEFWTIIQGRGTFVNNKGFREVSEGDTIFIPKGSLHSIKATSEGFKFYEVQIGDQLREDDIERLCTDWNKIRQYLGLFHGNINNDE